MEGSQVLRFSNVFSYVRDALNLTSDPDQRVALERYSDLPIRRSTAAAVNVRDQIHPDNVNDGLPAQFVAEEADRRLYWTLPMINDVSEVWKAAAAAAAFNGAKCAYGGISQATSDKEARTASCGEAAAPPAR